MWGGVLPWARLCGNSFRKAVFEYAGGFGELNTLSNSMSNVLDQNEPAELLKIPSIKTKRYQCTAIRMLFSTLVFM